MREVHIGRVLVGAAAVGRAAWTGGAVNPEALPAAVVRLFTLLRERRIPFVLVGGIAMLSYVSGRNTEDIDLILDRADLRRMPELTVIDENETFGRALLDGLQVDLLFAGHKLFGLVQRRFTEQRQFVEMALPCATVEGLLLLKLFALPSLYRQGDFARVNLYESDIAALLQAYQPDMPLLLAELSHHLSATDMAALNDILADIKSRLERFSRGLDT